MSPTPHDPPLPDPSQRANEAQERAVALCADAIGEIMRFWNFKPSMGRIWTVLYLSTEPMDADEIERIAGLSAGNVSMTLQDLLQWGVVRRVPDARARRRLYVAETDILSLVGHVLRERELRLIDQTIAQLEEAVRLLDAEGRSSQPAAMLHGRFLVTRIERLLELTRVGRRIVDRLAATGNADLGPIRELLRLRRA